MIVSLKHFKKQWSDLPAIGISSCKGTDPDPSRTLYLLTALQLWFQSFSIILLIVSSWLIESKIEKSGNMMSKHPWIEFGFYDTFLLFQICDVIPSMYASYHLRSATIRYSNIQDVRIWIIVKNFYLLSLVMCFLFVWYRVSNGVGSLEICIKSICIAIFASYKIYIVHQICKDEKSSYIFLEQSPPPCANSSKFTDGDHIISAQNYVVNCDAESTENDNFEPLLCMAN